MTPKKKFKKAKWDSLNYYELRESRRNQKTVKIKNFKKENQEVKHEVIRRGKRIISKGELTIRKVLAKHGVKFKREKTFSSLKNPKTGQNLRFDFYLPEYKTLIEFDGLQHTVRLKGMSRAELVNQMYRDEIKNKWAESRGYRLIRIPSKDYHLIEEIILDIIREESKE